MPARLAPPSTSDSGWASPWPRPSTRSLAGIEATGALFGAASRRMCAVGHELAARLRERVHDLDLEDRGTPTDRGRDQEQVLARILLASAWYQVLARNPFGFLYTPLYITASEDPAGFNLDPLVQLPHPDLVADVVVQLHQAAHGPLRALRDRSQPGDCVGGLTFAGVEISADADLAVDSLLLDFTSTKRPDQMEKRTSWGFTP